MLQVAGQDSNRDRQPDPEVNLCDHPIYFLDEVFEGDLLALALSDLHTFQRRDEINVVDVMRIIGELLDSFDNFGYVQMHPEGSQCVFELSLGDAACALGIVELELAHELFFEDIVSNQGSFDSLYEFAVPLWVHLHFGYPFVVSVQLLQELLYLYASILITEVS